MQVRGGRKFSSSFHPSLPPSDFTIAFEALVDDPVEEGAAVVAESGAAVGVHLELVLRPAVLRGGVGEEEEMRGVRTYDILQVKRS